MTSIRKNIIGEAGFVWADLIILPLRFILIAVAFALSPIPFLLGGIFDE